MKLGADPFVEQIGFNERTVLEADRINQGFEYREFFNLAHFRTISLFERSENLLDNDLASRRRVFLGSGHWQLDDYSRGTGNGPAGPT